MKVELPAIQWGEGQLYKYSFLVETRVEIAAAPTGRLKVKGVLEILPTIEGASKPGWLSVQLKQVEFEPAPEADKSQYETLKTELEAAAAAVRFEKGVLAEQLLHVDASPVGANLLRTLFAQLQLAPGATSTQHHETDATGTYEAVYEVLPTGEIRKSKQRYTRVNVDGYNRGRDGAAPVPMLDEAHATYKIDKNQLRSVRLEERVRSEMDGKTVLEATNKVSLELIGTQPGVAPGLSNIRAKTLPWPLDESRLGSGRSGQFDPMRVADIKYDTAVARLLELRKETNGGDFSGGANGVALDEKTRLLRREQLTEYQRNFDALTAHIRMDPATVRKISARLKNAPADEQDLLVDALGAAGTPEAQRLLLGLAADDSWPLLLRGDAANRAARAEVPVPELEGTLLVLAHHPRLGEYGLFALGTLSRRLRETKQFDRAKTVDDLLLQELKEAKTNPERRRVLLGMSNAGSPILVGAISGHVAAEDKEIATAAVAALRLIETPEATGLLVRALKDERRSVRRQVLEAIKTRSLSDQVIRAVIALVDDGDPADGAAGIRLLGSWRHDSAVARDGLVRLSQSAPSPQLQAAAREQLAGAPNH